MICKLCGSLMVTDHVYYEHEFVCKNCNYRVIYYFNDDYNELITNGSGKNEIELEIVYNNNEVISYNIAIADGQYYFPEQFIPLAEFIKILDYKNLDKIYNKFKMFVTFE